MNLTALEQCVRKWQLTAEGGLIITHTSRLLPVRHFGQPAMLKVFSSTSDEQSAADVLHYFAGNGAVRLVVADDNGLLMERAAGDVSLRAMALGGADDEAAAILADCISQLHAPRHLPHPKLLTSLSCRFESLFAQQAQLPILSRCAAVAKRLLSEEREITVLHGDLHHDNVLSSCRGWLAIDPKGMLGERSYEVANLLGNPWPHGELVHQPERMLRHARLYAAWLDLDPDRVLGFALAHAGLSAAWSIEDGRDPSYRLTCAALLDPLVA